jgi:hypothetical protein
VFNGVEDVLLGDALAAGRSEISTQSSGVPQLMGT